MRTRFLGLAVVLVCAPACGRHGGGVATFMSGAAHAFARADQPAHTGVEIRVLGGSSHPDSSMLPNAGGVTARQIGDDREVAIAVGWQVAGGGGRHGPGGFARLTANLIEWDRVAGVERLTAGGPSFELGFVPGGAGLCGSVAATWDVRLEAPDRAIVAGFLGFCVIGR